MRWPQWFGLISLAAMWLLAGLGVLMWRRRIPRAIIEDMWGIRHTRGDGEAGS